MTARRDGFTIVEVLVAVVVLGVGIIALVGSSGTVNRMLGAGRRSTNVAQIIEERMETLRQAAYSTPARCTSLVAGTTTQTRPGGITESWTIAVPAGLNQRNVTVNVTYRTGRGNRTVAVSTIIPCQ